MKDPKDSDNWVIWGLILRTVGSYEPARHKFKKAVRINPSNEAAKFELDIVERIIELDKVIPLD